MVRFWTEWQPLDLNSFWYWLLREALQKYWFILKFQRWRNKVFKGDFLRLCGIKLWRFRKPSLSHHQDSRSKSIDMCYICFFHVQGTDRESRDSSVGIATGYGLEFESRQGQEFSLLHVVQTGSGAHTAFSPMGIGGSFPWGKASEAWSWPFTSS
jgi:hypothetical protein